MPETKLVITDELVKYVLDELGKQAFLEGKFWHDANGTFLERNVGECIALMHSELSEALEGDRKQLMDKHLPHYPQLVVELADCILRIVNFCGAKGLPLGAALVEKKEYNKHREDHKMENRLAPGGKRY